MSEQAHAKIQESAPMISGVFALLTAKPGVTREQIMSFMPAEIRATVQLYLEGKIRDWYARADGKGAVFLLNAKDEVEAESIMESLPLAQEHLLDHLYMPVNPLKPLGLLLGSQSVQR